jgi:hypothetical protein
MDNENIMGEMDKEKSVPNINSQRGLTARFGQWWKIILRGDKHELQSNLI